MEAKETKKILIDFVRTCRSEDVRGTERIFIF